MMTMSEEKNKAKFMFRCFNYAIERGDMKWVDLATTKDTPIKDVSKRIVDYILSKNYDKKVENKILEAINKVKYENSDGFPSNFMDALVEEILTPLYGCDQDKNNKDVIVIHTEIGEFRFGDRPFGYRERREFNGFTLTSEIRVNNGLILVSKGDKNILVCHVYDVYAPLSKSEPYFFMFDNYKNIDEDMADSLVRDMSVRVKEILGCLTETSSISDAIDMDYRKYFEKHIPFEQNTVNK